MRASNPNRGAKPGERRGGRQKGSQNKATKAIKDMIADKPGDFVKCVAGLMPKDIQININDTSEMSDDELAQRVRDLAAQLAPLLALGVGDAQTGTGDAGGKALPARVH